MRISRSDNLDEKFRIYLSLDKIFQKKKLKIMIIANNKLKKKRKYSKLG